MGVGLGVRKNHESSLTRFRPSGGGGHLRLISNLPRIEEGLVDAEVSQISGQSQGSVYEADGAPPSLFSRRSVHVYGVCEVDKNQTARRMVTQKLVPAQASET